MLVLPNIDFLVDPAEAVEAIRRAYFAEAKFLPRQALTVGETWFAPMVGHIAGQGITVKLVGIYPKARPTVKAVVMVFDPETGTPQALINGTQLTAWRTAAASAVAAQALGARPAEVGVVGAGVQGEYHIRVFKALYPHARFKIYDVSEERAREVAAKWGGEAASLPAALRSDLVIAATTSKTPVVAGRELREGAAVISIGAPRPVRELDDEVKRRAGCMLVDNPHAAEETDDVGGSWVYIGDFLRGRECRFGEIKVYKSVGNPLFDAAMANYLLEKAKRAGAGVEVRWD
ncbi:ornithine cyclodeaminase family protein [Pyrobaculum neutrophilum]|uniref:Ornithine cyclodeaminase/mu-crystallin n=1 Tax=Pyrobaculum neutrophilum (strain DSM 2338 / JCM 9278 / NBRC 100436 / V24Sta) TaxID=444157 RepID=B1Y8P1_PYRNV|nr:ornithine cyclodeaminase family protein [Pyrobaculum neutrophilum]ACB40120.1 ornithine cyclodeaminase/mu-crystallin [Pyrobaculum neutrophilum V24Sta]